MARRTTEVVDATSRQGFHRSGSVTPEAENTDFAVEVVLDRVQAEDPANTITFTMEVSYDGGTTYAVALASTFAGGVTGRDGQILAGHRFGRPFDTGLRPDRVRVTLDTVRRQPIRCTLVEDVTSARD